MAAHVLGDESTCRHADRRSEDESSGRAEEHGELRARRVRRVEQGGELRLVAELRNEDGAEDFREQIEIHGLSLT